MTSDIINRIQELDFSKEFIVDDILSHNYSYNEFFDKALAMSKYINEHVTGKSIIAVMENSFNLALLYFAVMFTDKRIMVIDPQKGKDEICSILCEIEPTCIFYDEELLPEGTNPHKRLIYPDINGNVFDCENIKDMVISGLKMRDENSPYLVTFTSGTSGVTKGVEHTADNLFLTALALEERVGVNGGSFLHVMPMTYMAGILNSLIYPFIIGDRIIITARFSIFSARNFWTKVIRYGIDLFWLSPAMLMMIDRMDRKNDGENYCREHEMTFLIGTAPLTNELRMKFNTRYGVNVSASYGLSETLFVSVETKESKKKSVVNCVGELLPGVEFRFSGSGEMYIRVPWMYLGYTNENTDEYFDGEYYKSGDLAKIENDCLYITGRSKDLIIKGGMNISPILIENVIYKNQKILENVVVGVKDETGEEKICCFYVLKDESDEISELEAGLKKQVLEELGKNYSVDYLWKLKEIPRNINGKTDKNVLRQMWETQYAK